MKPSAHVIDLDDILMFDPFTFTGKDKLNNLKVKITPDEFFESYYCEPFFCQENTSKLKVAAPTAADIAAADIAATDDLSHRLLDAEINHLKAQKEYFENILDGSENPLRIMGYSGSGKSVYLNYCLHKIKDKRHFFVFNLEESLGIIKGPDETELNINFKIENIPNKAPWFFAGLLIENTYNIITGILQDESQEIIDGIQKQYEFLSKNKMGGYRTLFAAFKKIDNESESKTERNIFDGLEALMHKESGKNDIRSIIQRILEALTKFLFCYVEAQESIKRQNIKGYIFGFDNIEHYIKDSATIFDNDIVLICEAIDLFISGARKEYEKIDKIFSEYFKFILVLRDTTARFLPSPVHGSGPYGNVDVSSWYLFKEIQNKKEGVLEKISSDKIEKACKTLAILKVIADDNEGKGQSFNTLFSEMYNHNKRRTVRILNKVIPKMVELESENTNLVPLATFLSYWGEHPFAYKYLCRRALIRLIFDFIDLAPKEDVHKTSFFDKIHVNHTAEEIGTYARRVLCFMLYKSKGKIDENYVSFYDFVKGIFEPPANNKIDEKVFNELAEVLLVMNETSFDIYNWVQLIVIKFNSTPKIIKEDLAKKLKESYENKIEKDDDFGIRITNAGRFFAYIQSDFEYFSSRYCRDISAFSPLIWVKDKKAAKKIIMTVFDNAKKCMDIITNFEKDYFRDYKEMYDKEYFYKWTLLGEKKSSMPHPYRIIDAHCTYLEHYKVFLDAEKDKNGPRVFSYSDIKELRKWAERYIKKYKIFFSKLEEEKDTQQNSYFCSLGENLLAQYRFKDTESNKK
jgi:hypothetical protein